MLVLYLPGWVFALWIIFHIYVWIGLSIRGRWWREADSEDRERSNIATFFFHFPVSAFSGFMALFLMGQVVGFVANIESPFRIAIAGLVSLLILDFRLQKTASEDEPARRIHEPTAAA